MFAVDRDYPAQPEARYALLAEQLRALTEGERRALPNLANAAALIFSALDRVNWVGFYLRSGQELVLGPFQGLPACIAIPWGRGVCGLAAQTGQSVLVKDVHAFDGHIACDADSLSELVVPLKRDGEVIGVLDIDSPVKARFDEADQAGIETLARILEGACDWDRLY